MTGYYSTFEDNKDLELVTLLNNMSNTPIGTDWVEPPCVMDLVLGDTLLKLARIKFKGSLRAQSLQHSYPQLERGVRAKLAHLLKPCMQRLILF
jgi:hypothetical protein